MSFLKDEIAIEARLTFYRDNNAYYCRVEFYADYDEHKGWIDFTDKADDLFGDLIHLNSKFLPLEVSNNAILLSNHFLQGSDLPIQYDKFHCDSINSQLSEISYFFQKPLDLNIFDIYFSSAPDHSYIFYDETNGFSLEGKHISPKELLLNQSKRSLATVYVCDSLVEVLYSFLHYFASQSVDLLKCERCGKWFIPDNTLAQKYCRRMYGDMNCSQLASKTLREKRGDTPITAAYHRVDNMLRKRKNADPEHMKEADQLLWDQFRAKYKANKKIMSNDELLQWLEGQAKRLSRKGVDKDT